MGWTFLIRPFSVGAIEQSATAPSNPAAATAPATRRPSSPRAAASIVFACSSLFLWHIYGQVHWATQSRLFGGVKEQLAFADSELVLAYFGMAGLATIWCLWSWFTESRFSAIIATIFTFIAVALVTTMSMHITP